MQYILDIVAEKPTQTHLPGIHGKSHDQHGNEGRKQAGQISEDKTSINITQSHAVSDKQAELMSNDSKQQSTQSKPAKVNNMGI